jgi:hypothetical protein
VFPPLAGFSVAIELLAPLAVLSRRVGRWFALGMWGFHVGVLLTMWIFFPYPISFVAFAPFFDAERFVERVRARLPFFRTSR